MYACLSDSLTRRQCWMQCWIVCVEFHPGNHFQSWHSRSFTVSMMSTDQSKATRPVQPGWSFGLKPNNIMGRHTQRPAISMAYKKRQKCFNEFTHQVRLCQQRFAAESRPVWTTDFILTPSSVSGDSSHNISCSALINMDARSYQFTNESTHTAQSESEAAKWIQPWFHYCRFPPRDKSVKAALFFWYHLMVQMTLSKSIRLT